MLVYPKSVCCRLRRGNDFKKKKVMKFPSLEIENGITKGRARFSNDYSQVWSLAIKNGLRGEGRKSDYQQIDCKIFRYSMAI